MTDFIVIVVLLVIIATAVIYIRRQKKKGVQCIGCPSSGKCKGNCGSHAKEQ